MGPRDVLTSYMSVMSLESRRWAPFILGGGWGSFILSDASGGSFFSISREILKPIRRERRVPAGCPGDAAAGVPECLRLRPGRRRQQQRDEQRREGRWHLPGNMHRWRPPSAKASATYSSLCLP